MGIFDAAATREALPLDGLVSTLPARFAVGDVGVPARHVHEMGSARWHRRAVRPGSGA